MLNRLNALDSSLVKHVPGYWRLRNAWLRRFAPLSFNPFLSFAPPGHFYSPLPDIDFVNSHQTALFERQTESIPGILNRTNEQLALIDKLSEYYGELPFEDRKSNARRYYFENSWFSYGDAIILYAMLRHFRPRRVIEVGSGFSSAVTLDTNDLFLSKSTKLTFIEPNPDRLYSLLSDSDRKQHEVLVDIVQAVPLDRFAALEENDILFIDSSHVAKIGSDVVHLLTHVLPALQDGVIVHFHDVFWPFEYPEEWVRGGRAWNENYVLKAFLQFNSTFEIMCFNSYLAVHHGKFMAAKLPLFESNPGGGLWLRKIPSAPSH